MNFGIGTSSRSAPAARHALRLLYASDVEVTTPGRCNGSGDGYDRFDDLDLVPQLVGNDGVRAMHAAIADPNAWALELKVDGVRGLLVFDGDHIEVRNRKGQRVAVSWLAINTRSCLWMSRLPLGATGRPARPEFACPESKIFPCAWELALAG